MGYILMSKYITCILRITPPEEISAVADELKWLFDKGGGTGKPPEEFLGRCNSPIHPSGYVRVAVLEDYAPAIEYLKATVSPPAEEVKVEEEGEVPIKGEPVKGGGKILPSEIVKPSIAECLKPERLTVASEKMEMKFAEAVSFCDVKIAEMEVMEEPVEGEKTHLIEIISVEWDGQKMFQVGVDADDNPEYLGLIGMCPMYVEPVQL
jgi:hypothetical protein